VHDRRRIGANRGQPEVLSLAARSGVALVALLLAAAVCGAIEPLEAPPPRAIKLNQVGFYPAARKIAVVPAGPATEFVVTSPDSEITYLSGTLGGPELWSFSGETVRIADFSAFRRPGRYRLTVERAGESHIFTIDDKVYGDLVAAVLKAFFYSRSGIDLEPEHAGRWARRGGHRDLGVRVHASAASESRPAGSIIASPGGWYDAGDYNKYMVNSAVTTFTLLAAYRHYPEYFAHLEVGIPESGNGVPDIIDEAVWNLRWMLTMQDPEDGGVYHKLTTEEFERFVMPHEAQAPRFVVQKSTAATLDFAATAAMASRVLKEWENLRPLAQKCLEAALAAWEWARRHPGILYRQPPDVATGAYAPGWEDLEDERAWAAVELFLATGGRGHLEAIELAALPGGVPSWDWVAPLVWISLAHSDLLPPALSSEVVRGRILGTADRLRRQAQTSAYRVVMGAFPERSLEGASGKDFSWGGNGVAGNQGIILLTAFALTGDRSFVDATLANLDYLLGRNATGYCFVTGFGSRSPQHIHHRPSAADGIPQPVPGLVVGGPHNGFQDTDDCLGLYPSKQPALAYLDDLCSYATNEVAINWNAPWVYVLGVLEHIHRQHQTR